MPSETTELISERPAVHGGARLQYAFSETIGTQLQQQWVRPPLHLAKAYHEKDWAISIMTSPTAGLLDGDRLEVSTVVEQGAKAALISPAACRVHTMNSGYATVEQHYTVESGAVLDVWPAPMVLQKNASLRQSTGLDVAADATVLFGEVVTPGRAAFGECFEFSEWRSRLKIYREGVLLSLENFICRPDRGDLADWRSLYPEGNYASFYYLTPQPTDTLVEALHELDLPGATIGASPLRVGGIGVKLLASNGVQLRKAVAAIRSLLIPHTKVDFPYALQRAQTFFH